MKAEFPGAVPEIPVRDIDEATAYYESNLGFTVDWRGEEVGLAGISKGNCRMFLASSDHRKAYGNTGPVLTWLNLDSKEDVEDLYRLWSASEAKLISAPESKPWGLHEFTAADPDGNLFRVFYDFATPERLHTDPGHLVKLHKLIPMLPVRSMPASVDFYQKLGFSTEKRNDDWRWAMLSSGECRLMVDESTNVHPDIPRTSVLYLYPDDISEFHEQARRNGLVVPELQVTFYGMTEFRIDDPDGNRLWFGQDRSSGPADSRAAKLHDDSSS